MKLRNSLALRVTSALALSAALYSVPAPAAAAGDPPEPLAEVIGGANLPELSANLAEAMGPADNHTLFLSEPGSALAFAVAAGNAAKTKGSVIAARNTNPTDILRQIASLGATKIELVGSPDGFPDPVVAALSQSFPVSTSLVSHTSAEWSVASLTPSYRDKIVVAGADVVNSPEIGTSLAVHSGASLVVLDGTEAPDWVRRVLEDPIKR